MQEYVLRVKALRFEEDQSNVAAFVKFANVMWNSVTHRLHATDGYNDYVIEPGQWFVVYPEGKPGGKIGVYDDEVFQRTFEPVGVMCDSN